MVGSLKSAYGTAAVLAAGLVLGSGGIGTSLAEKRLPESRPQMALSFAPLVKKTAPAVVNIYTSKVVRTRRMVPLFDDPFFRRFFGENFGPSIPDGGSKRVQNSLGSGVIVDAKGIIVTNQHVIEGADQVTVVLADRREFRAVIEGADERTDLAVLRIDTGGEALPFLDFRDSDDLEVGDLVLAIGNPFGVGQTVTSGIVSAVARSRVGISDLNSFIQTDAAINPGNSGGALVTMDGRLVGINSAIFSKSGGSLGIGFAIPSNMVRSVIAGITGTGEVVRPWLGAWGQAVSADIAASLGLERPAGVLVNDVYRGGPADAAGLRIGDVVLAINGRRVNDPQALGFRLATLAVGGTAELRVWRKRRRFGLDVALIAPPADPPADTTALNKGEHPLLGATVANLSPALANKLNLGAFEPGVIVLEVARRSPARRFGFKPGDIVLALNDSKVESVAWLGRTLLGRLDHWQITIKRRGKTLTLNFNR